MGKIYTSGRTIVDRYDDSQTVPTYQAETYTGSNVAPVNPQSATYTGGASSIIEPQILTPNTRNDTPIRGAGTNAGQVGGNSQSGTSPVVNPNAEPSATSGATKTYVSGGTTPDSNIIINKPKPNYLVYGLIGVVGLYVVYKVFFNKKGE
jgi:hypothetical protein